MVNPWTIDLAGSNPTALDWATAARRLLRDARLLLGDASWQNAYMQAGMAVEFALKARIMHTERLNAWPSKKQRPELYTHELDKLARVANLRIEIEKEISNQSDIGLAWLVIKDFDINSRYPAGKPFPKKLAADSVLAIDGLGLVEWLITGIR